MGTCPEGAQLDEWARRPSPAQRLQPPHGSDFEGVKDILSQVQNVPAWVWLSSPICDQNSFLGFLLYQNKTEVPVFGAKCPLPPGAP